MNRSTFTIPATHPCLPGHFPHDPIVPGVVVLERVIEAVTARGACRAAAVQRCKFVGPLRPGQPCTVEWSLQDDAVRFVCSSADGVLVRGTLKVADG